MLWRVENLNVSLRSGRISLAQQFQFSCLQLCSGALQALLLHTAYDRPLVWAVEQTRMAYYSIALGVLGFAPRG